MKLNPRNMPGPGDPVTWGKCTNHPNDPRTPEPYEPTNKEMDDEIETLLRDSGEFWDAFEQPTSEASTDWYAVFHKNFLNIRNILNDEDKDECVKEWLVMTELRALHEQYMAHFEFINEQKAITNITKQVEDLANDY